MDSDANDTDARSTGRRDVVVPMRLYKTVVVFSTLIAVVAVIFGFALLDAATLQFSIIRRVLVSAVNAIGLSPPSNALSAVLAIVGLAFIGLGAGVYVLGTRFRARGMGNAEEDTD